MPPKVPFASFWILICGPHDSPDLKFQLGLLGEIDFFAIFVLFLVDFHSARLFLQYTVLFVGSFLHFFGLWWGGDDQGSIFSFCTFCVFAFLAVFGIFWHLFGIFWVSVEVWAF